MILIVAMLLIFFQIIERILLFCNGNSCKGLGFEHLFRTGRGEDEFVRYFC